MCCCGRSSISQSMCSSMERMDAWMHSVPVLQCLFPQNGCIHGKNVPEEGMIGFPGSLKFERICLSHTNQSTNTSIHLSTRGKHFRSIPLRQDRTIELKKTEEEEGLDVAQPGRAVHVPYAHGQTSALLMDLFSIMKHFPVILSVMEMIGNDELFFDSFFDLCFRCLIQFMHCACAHASWHSSFPLLQFSIWINDSDEQRTMANFVPW